MGVKVHQLIRLLLVDPQDLIDRVLETRLTERHDRDAVGIELIPILDIQHLLGMGGSSIGPLGSDLEPIVRYPFIDDTIAVFDKYIIRVAHFNFTSLMIV